MGQASSRGEALNILANQASSGGQALQIVARLATETKWANIDRPQLQKILELPAGVLGERFGEFLLKHAVPRKFLALIETVMIPTTAHFIPDLHFQQTLERDAKVRIGSISNVFRDSFLPANVALAEDNTPETALGIYELLYAARGTRVVEGLHAQERRRSRLSTIWFFLEKQGRGQEGVLSVTESNVFFVNDMRGVGRAAVLYWNSVSDWWELDLDTMKKPDRWDKGARFFCPDLGL